MKILAHVFLDNNLRSKPMLGIVPRTGETVRLRGDIYGRVTEVIWCLERIEG